MPTKIQIRISSSFVRGLLLRSSLPDPLQSLLAGDDATGSARNGTIVSGFALISLAQRYGVRGGPPVNAIGGPRRGISHNELRYESHGSWIDKKIKFKLTCHILAEEARDDEIVKVY